MGNGAIFSRIFVDILKQILNIEMTNAILYFQNLSDKIIVLQQNPGFTEQELSKIFWKYLDNFIYINMINIAGRAIRFPANMGNVYVCLGFF